MTAMAPVNESCIPPPFCFALLQRLKDDFQGLRQLRNTVAQNRTARGARQDVSSGSETVSHLRQALRGVEGVFYELNGGRHGADLKWLAQQYRKCSNEPVDIGTSEYWDTEESWSSQCSELLENVAAEVHAMLAGELVLVK